MLKTYKKENINISPKKKKKTLCYIQCMYIEIYMYVYEILEYPFYGFKHLFFK